MTNYVVKLVPEEIEFSEGIENTKKICAFVDELDCVAEITGIEFDSDVPDFIKNKLLTTMKGRIISITNQFANTSEDDQGNITANALYNYAVEIIYQKPLIQTNEATSKVMAEHQEKLKNDEGIKDIKEILTKLNEQFPATPPVIKPVVISNINNPLVVGTEISDNQLKQMREDYTKALDMLTAINFNYFRPNYINVNNSNDIAYVTKDFRKFNTLYNDSIKETLTDNSRIEADKIIGIINGVINTNKEVNTNNGNLIYINFSREEEIKISTGLVELNNLLTNVFSAYNEEYDSGVLTNLIKEAELINQNTIDRCK